MAKKETFYHAFTQKSTGRMNRLISQANIAIDNAPSNPLTALWDTGATNTCISTQIAENLSLVPTGKRKIMTPSGDAIVNTYMITVMLPNGVAIRDVLVSDSTIGAQGLDMLIGMDIIGLGDFAVSNFSGKTAFSFRIPSKEFTDYVSKSNADNLLARKRLESDARGKSPAKKRNR
jgi:predicted aspartyl protease